MNADTGETLWENDYLTRIQSMGHNQANNSPGLRLALSPSAAAGIAFGGGGGVGGVNVRKSMQLVDNDGEDEVSLEKFKSILLYTGGVFFHVGWCIR